MSAGFNADMYLHSKEVVIYLFSYLYFDPRSTIVDSTIVGQAQRYYNRLSY